MKNLASLLACPVCKNEVKVLDDVASCARCNIDFPHRGRVFKFICCEMYGSPEEFNNSQRIIDFWGNGWAKRLRQPDHNFVYELSPDRLRDYASVQRRRYEDRGSLMGTELDLSSIEGKVGLNIGCGAGTESLVLTVFGADCIAMDITSEAASAADQLIKTVGGAGFGIQGDARFLPARKSALDFVFSNGVLHHSPDIMRSIEEIHRVLKPGGTACIMLYAKWSSQFLQERMRGILKGNITPKKQKEFINSHTEAAWKTESQHNPLTDLFTVAACRKLFRNFKKVLIRKSDFRVSEVALLNRLLPLKIQNSLNDRLSPLLESYLGGSISIKAEK